MAKKPGSTRKVFAVRLTPKLILRLKLYAAKTQRSMEDLVNDVVAKALDERGAPR